MHFVRHPIELSVRTSIDISIIHTCFVAKNLFRVTHTKSNLFVSITLVFSIIIDQNEILRRFNAIFISLWTCSACFHLSKTRLLLHIPQVLRILTINCFRIYTRIYGEVFSHMNFVFYYYVKIIP